MGDGETVAINSTIDINPHSEMVWWMNGAIAEWWNGEMVKSLLINDNMVKPQGICLFTIKLIFLPVLTQIFPDLIS